MGATVIGQKHMLSKAQEQKATQIYLCQEAFCSTQRGRGPCAALNTGTIVVLFLFSSCLPPYCLDLWLSHLCIIRTTPQLSTQKWPLVLTEGRDGGWRKEGWKKGRKRNTNKGEGKEIIISFSPEHHCEFKSWHALEFLSVFNLFQPQFPFISMPYFNPPSSSWLSHFIFTCFFSLWFPIISYPKTL